ncbi:hypothetical protein GTO91_09795 [Heliobacterium undosum]|uniref:N-acetyl sugar amidotransferase n=1 Tax=Heliomicrobium undosum TaxID=121734 RepID=A0A845L2T1_9FIRM|nr:hypothetical protein [Heliomicrobium undosum]MZP29996.1 hypothetical protein [Heliomicrobium undosum]
MNRCASCLLPEGKFEVKLDDRGTCNYCNYYNEHKADIHNYPLYEPLLSQRFEKVRGKYAYDIAVGLSGGKDSTYVLYKMVTKYKLKVLAITYDNGFLTDFSLSSIRETVKTLGVDHYYHKPNWKIHQKFYKAAMNKLGDPCIACAFGGYFLGIKLCLENKIPFLVHGRSPFQMYRNFFPGSRDIFLPMMAMNRKEHDFNTIASVMAPIHERMRDWIRQLFDQEEDAREVLGEFFVAPDQFVDRFTPEFLAYFLFTSYNEERMKKELCSAINWRRPDNDYLLGHYDCKIHDAAGYLYKSLNGINVLEPDIAVMLRFGSIQRQEAKILMDISEPDDNDLQQSLQSLYELCALDPESLSRLLHRLKEQGCSKFESR